MMWPRLSKQFFEVAQLQAVSHSRRICCHLFWGNPVADARWENDAHYSQPKRADLSAELVLIQAKLWQREASAVIQELTTSRRHRDQIDLVGCRSPIANTTSSSTEPRDLPGDRRSSTAGNLLPKGAMGDRGTKSIQARCREFSLRGRSHCRLRGS